MKTPKQIQRKVANIKKKEDALHDELLHLQRECGHSNLVKEYKGNTGNYDPSADCYWIDYKCPDCEKTWCEDQ